MTSSSQHKLIELGFMMHRRGLDELAYNERLHNLVIVRHNYGLIALYILGDYELKGPYSIMLSTYQHV